MWTARARTFCAGFWGAITCAAWPCAAQDKAPDETVAEGFTLDVALTLGATQTRTFGFASSPYGGVFYSFDKTKFGVSVPSVSMGGWLQPRIALGARLTNVWYVPDRGEVSNGYLGAELQGRVHPAWILAGGLGVQLVGDTPVLNDGNSQEVGVGAALRAKFLPWRRAGHGLGLTVEFVPGLVDESFTYSAGAGLVWTMF